MAVFCERLIDLQTSRNVLKKDVAKAIGISVMAYYRYEVGQREPGASVLIALADFFDVSLDYLVGRSDDPKRH
jgi:transcriptional regulator with XRE-family HTH domain